MKRGYYQQLNSMWQALASPTGAVELFDESIIRDLPETAQRYLLHAIRPGTPLTDSVQLRMSGHMRLKPDGKWMPMNAEQILAPPRGFIWKAEVTQSLLRMSGADCYFEGDARLRFWLWGLIPLVNGSGPDIVQSAAGRLAIECIWLPSALLPNRGAEWEAVDDTRARVTIPIGKFRETVTMTIGESGELQHIEMLRWGDRTADGAYARIPFGGTVETEGTFGGYTIPAHIRVGWWPNSDKYFEFFRSTIEHAEF